MIIPLYITLICLVLLLLTLVEAVILTWLKWAGFGRCLMAALAANFGSSIALGILLIWVEQPHLSDLIVSWLVSLLIEAFILNLFHQKSVWRNLYSSALANLASYVILILPAFYYGLQNLA